MIFCAPAVETAPAKHAKPAFAGWGRVVSEILGGGLGVGAFLKSAEADFALFITAN